MGSSTEIQSALRQLLPAELHSAIPLLASTLTDLAAGALSPLQGETRLGASSDVAQALRVLAGHELTFSSAAVSFGAGAQTGDITIGDVAGGNIVKLHVGAINIYYTPLTSGRSRQEQRNRKAMLAKLKSIWIDGFLNKSLTNELRIELNLTDRPDAVEIPINALYQERQQEPQPIPAGTSIIDVFDQASGELLILGAPGAGKTTLLLELLRDLLVRAGRDDAHPVPIVFPLTTWAAEQKPLAQWMVDQLNIIYDVPKKISKTWLTENEVLPLLDGLDEVSLEHRDSCVEAINFYRQKVGGLVPTVVSSRIADYESLKVRLRIRGAVLVEPLTLQQVKSYLIQVGEPLRAVYELVETDRLVGDLFDSPLILSVAGFAFQNTSIQTLKEGGNTEEKRVRLWETYIERMFERKGKEMKYSREKTLRWLSWLSAQMIRQRETTFFIEGLQSTWLPRRSSRLMYLIIDRYVVGFIAGLIISFLMASLRNPLRLVGPPLENTLINGLLYGMCVSVFGGIMALEALQQRNLSEKIVDMTKGSIVSVVVSLCGLAVTFTLFNLQLTTTTIYEAIAIGVLIGGPMGLLIGKPGFRERKVLTTEQLEWSFRNITKQSASLIMILISIGIAMTLIGLSFTDDAALILKYISTNTLVHAIPLMLFLGLSANSIPTRNQPNEGIRRSTRTAFVGGLCGLMFFWLCNVIVAFFIMRPLIWRLENDLDIVALSDFLYTAAAALVTGSLFMMEGFFAFGGYAVLSHIIIRTIVFLYGHLPFKLASFLNHCVDRLFLRRVGGGYVFIHRMLLEHFAAKYKETKK